MLLKQNPPEIWPQMSRVFVLLICKAEAAAQPKASEEIGGGLEVSVPTHVGAAGYATCVESKWKEDESTPFASAIAPNVMAIFNGFMSVALCAHMHSGFALRISPSALLQLRNTCLRVVGAAHLGAFFLKGPHWCSPFACVRCPHPFCHVAAHP